MLIYLYNILKSSYYRSFNTNPSYNIHKLQSLINNNNNNNNVLQINLSTQKYITANKSIGNIYIISDPDSEQNKKYKIGITCRCKSKLISDYRRSRPEIKCYMFLTGVYNYKNIEKKILKNFDRHRIINYNGRKSEWIIGIDVDYIIKKINDIIDDDIISDFKIII